MIAINLKHTLNRPNRSDLHINVCANFCENKTITGIFGDSGTGKSRLLKCIAGLYSSNTFTLNIDGHEAQARPAHNNPCVYVGSEAVLFEHLSVVKNLKLIVNKTSYGQAPLLSLRDAVKCAGIEHLLQQFPSSLSSGEKQRVQFARALLSNKPVVLLDEAFSALDWNARMGMINTVKQLNSTTSLQFIIVSHSLKELSYCCQNIIKLHQGEIEYSASIDKMLSYLSQASHSSSMFSSFKLTFVDEDSSDHISKWYLHGEHQVNAQCVYVSASTATGMQRSGLANLSIDANQVSLSRFNNSQTSMLNSLTGVVSEVLCHENDAIVTLKVDTQVLRASISLRSLHALDIHLGQKLYALFKAL